MAHQVEIIISSDISEEGEERLKLALTNLLNAIGDPLASEVSVDREKRLIGVNLKENKLIRVAVHRIQKVVLENLNTSIQSVTLN